MSTSALIMMITVMVSVTAITGYYFYRILTIPPKPDSDETEEELED